MGTCFSSSGPGSGAKKGGKNGGATPAIQPPRRRLSVAFPHEEGGKGDAYDKQNDRSLLVELSKQTVVDIVKVPLTQVETETDKERHRRASFSGKTVKEMGAPLNPAGDLAAVGYACKKGLKPEAPNQDSFFVIRVPGDLAIYGVFDGHGPCGHDVSEFVKNELPKLLLKSDDLKKNPKQALINCFQKCQNLLEQATEMGKLSAQFSGTTATVCLHLMENDDLWIAHVGDSRAVLAREVEGGNMHKFAGEQQGAKIDHLNKDKNGVAPVLSTMPADAALPKSGYTAADLTHDHKPDDPKERERIEGAGGRVVFDGYYNYRVYARHGRYPGLNMSRALGDLAGYYDAGLSPLPDIAYHKLSIKGHGGGSGRGEVPGEVPGSKAKHADIAGRPGADKFMLICSDGVWEFISSQDSVDFCAPLLKTGASECAEQLARESWDRWTKHMAGQVVDDISVVVVNLEAA